jgi:hypothetical protein
MRRSLACLFPLFSLAVVACASSSGEGAAQSSQDELTGTCATPPDPTRSLFVTDATALAQFPMKSVLDQIAATGSGTGQTGTGVYQQMMDTLHTKAQGTTSGPHCDDVLVNGVPSINGFPVQCPRGEGDLSTTDPFGTGNDGYLPIGIVNRFDLAPKNGANCGQYRVVYGKRSGLSNGLDRVLVIFEAVLPNPTPAAGLVACLPVAQFWDDLTTDNVASSRAAKLATFYFTGLPGFAPVVDAAHYGIGGGTNTGQIRANMFDNAKVSDPWQLREFRLARACKPDGSGCVLTANNTSVADNPFGGLFAGTDAASRTYQTKFLNQVQHLAAKSVPNIGMGTPAVDNAGQSNEQDQTNDYGFQGKGNTQLLSSITAKLASIGRTDLTAQNILDRATTQSCAGCHELSNNKPLGGGLVWPSSNGFTQIDERSNLSPALTTAFLPARAKVLQGFINANCPGSAPQPAGGDPGTTLGGGEVGAAN